MVNCEIFATNFKLLRLSHFLSMSDLALILNFKNKSTIAQLETIKIFPSFETLLEIANLFAINIDWLVGRSSEPYSEEIILKLESEIMSIKLNADTEFRQSTPDIYSNIDKINTDKFKITLWDSGFWQIRKSLKDAKLASGILKNIKNKREALKKNILKEIDNFIS